MEDKYRTGELGDVEDAVLQPGMNPDLGDSGANACHRFPVRWLHALLHPAELVARLAPRIGREFSQSIQGRTEPNERSVRHL